MITPQAVFQPDVLIIMSASMTGKTTVYLQIVIAMKMREDGSVMMTVMVAPVFWQAAWIPLPVIMTPKQPYQMAVVPMIWIVPVFVVVMQKKIFVESAMGIQPLRKNVLSIIAIWNWHLTLPLDRAHQILRVLNRMVGNLLLWA